MKKFDCKILSGLQKLRKSKWWKVMRIVLFLITIGITQALALESYAQATRLSLNVENQPIQKILEIIEEQTEFRFMYDATVVDVGQKRSINCQNQPVAKILDDVFAGSGITYKVEDRQIALSNIDAIFNFNQVSQQHTVSGKVTDSGGQPLPGVTVVVKGTTRGTVTNANGEYSLSNTPEDATLVFSFVGMKTQEVAVGSQTRIDVTLDEETVGIEEVVAVGYGIQRKINMTGAVSMVKFDEEIENRPITNASQALSGKISGIWVSQNSGQPGSDGAQLRIRGWGTLNNTNPLVIIDGIEGDFNQINPNDIESISVLKDAASAAIYGSKAANGVILITTKTGKINERMKVSLTSYLGVQSLGRRFDVIDNSAEFMEIWNQGLVNEGSSPLFPDYLVNAFRKSNDRFKYPNTNFYDDFFRDATIQEHNVSIRGGSAQNALFLSFNYLNQEGMIPNTKSERYGIRANFDSEINRWFSLNGRLNYTRKISNEPYSWGNLWQSLRTVPPFTAPYTRDGRFGSVQAIDKDGNLLYDNRNPFIDAANGLTRTDGHFVTANVSAEIKLSNNLLIKTTLASSGNWNLTDKHNESHYGYTDTGIETITLNYNREGIEISRNHVSVLDNSAYTTLNYNRSIGNHSFSAIVGAQLEDQQIKNLYARRSDPPKEGLTQVDAGTDGIQGSGNMNGVRMFSYFGRGNYSFANKYLFEVNLRADASSRFKEKNRWGIFPGFSAGWRLVEEPFIENLGLFSNLKLRASWGQLGNQNIAGYWPYLTVITQNNSLSYNQNNSFAPGAAATSLIDENITWETTSTFDVGIDVGFVNNKINFEADYFKKKTTDIIVQLPIPNIMGGISPPFENVGEMLNSGIELTLNYDNQSISHDRFGYSFGINLTYVDNKVTKFRGGESPDQLYLIREGYSYRTLYGYKAVGIYQSDEEASEHMHSNSFIPKAGNLKFEDINDDGKLGFQDKQELGNTIPKYTFGVTSNFKYKGFDLNFLIQGLADVSVYTQSDITNLTTNVGVISKKWRNAWSQDNKNTDIPSLKFDNSWDNSQSSFWIHDISFIKLKNIQLGYALPDNITSSLKLQKIYLYANAQNVFTLVNNKYEGFDPERNTFDPGSSIYPIPRIISFGINLNF